MSTTPSTKGCRASGSATLCDHEIDSDLLKNYYSGSTTTVGVSMFYFESIDIELVALPGRKLSIGVSMSSIESIDCMYVCTMVLLCMRKCLV